MNTKRQQGFTLIEIMIALVILGILMAIALPAYNTQVVNTRVGECKAALLGFAQSMDKYYAVNYSYLDAAVSGADTGAPAGTLFPPTCTIEGDMVTYNLTIQASSATAYTLRATPASGSSQVGSGYLEVNSLGQRFHDKNNNGSIDTGENTWN
ncbi:MAG: type IV pilin protein [Halieaceae bacterium]